MLAQNRKASPRGAQKERILPRCLAWTATRATPNSRKTPGAVIGEEALSVDKAPFKRIRARALSPGGLEKRVLVPPVFVHQQQGVHSG